MLPVDHLRKVVAWCRERGALLVSDECYLECAWETDGRRSRCCTPTSATATTPGILAVHSLSKRSNLAGYRCAFVAGDPAVVGELLAVRKNLGLMMPGPQQVAMRAALDDDEHVAEQHARYAAPSRRACRAALEGAGFRIDHSEASLYLWATRDEPCWDTVGLARRARHPGRAGRVLRPRRRASTCGSRSPRPTSGSTAAVRRLAGGLSGRSARSVVRRAGPGIGVRAGAIGVRYGGGGEHADRGDAAHPDHARARPSSELQDRRRGRRRRRCGPRATEPSTRTCTARSFSWARFSAVPIV